MSISYVVDTNCLIENPDIVFENNIVVTSMVLRELENLEQKKNNEAIKYNIRKVKRNLLSENYDKEKVFVDLNDYEECLEGYSESYFDNIILEFAKKNGYGIITKDNLMILKARTLSIPYIDCNGFEDDDIYTGVVEFYYDNNSQKDNEIMNDIVLVTENPEYAEDKNPLNMWKNQYLIVWDKNKKNIKNGKEVGHKHIASYRFDGEKLKRINFKNIKNSFSDKVVPRNVKQMLAFDLLQDDEITVKALFGGYGVGKDFLMITHAVDMVLEQKFDKIVWIRNNVEVKDTNPIGFLPDSIEDKLEPFLAPLADHIGGKDSLYEFLDRGRVEVQHLGFVRGRDIKNSIIYVTECQSNTLEHIKLLIGRVGEGSQIWFNGDDNQVDSDKFKNNNGVSALKKLRGNKLYGEVIMDKTERSETAELAELLDK